MVTNGNYIQNQFCSYEIALALKELGFDEECFAFFNETYEQGYIQYSDIKYSRNYNGQIHLVSSPLWQQVIDWFRENHDLHIYNEMIGGEYYGSIDDPSKDYCIWQTKSLKSYYKVRKQAILKAIELCKNKK